MSGSSPPQRDTVPSRPPSGADIWAMLLVAGLPVAVLILLVEGAVLLLR